MSYHILHQFDEQWFGDSGQDEELQPEEFIGSSALRNRDRSGSRRKTSQRPWIIIMLSLFVAACSLYFAVDASRQTVELQQRVNELESRLKK